MITIYVGSTDHSHKFHVGMTERTVEQRWSDPDYRGKLSYKPTLLYSYEGSLRDEPIHALIKKDPAIGLVRDIIDIASDEIFIVSPAIADPKNYIVTKVKQAINQLVHGISRENSYSMRDEQRAAHDKALEAFQTGDRFLLNAKMRFGKTFTAYQIARSIGAKRILVLTYKPAVDDSWREDLEKHVDFNGWNYFSTKSDKFSSSNPIQLSGDSVEVLFSSFQDFNDFNKPKWQHAVDYDYDLLIVDEMHYGSDTERAKAALERLSFKRVLFVSGTPLKELAAGEFLDHEIFTWSYADEQSKRRLERDSGWATENYRWLPEMQFHTYEVCEEARRVIESYTDDEGFTMTKMFGSDDGETFLEQGVVKIFLDHMFGIVGKPKTSPIKQFACDHMLMVLPPSVKSVSAMCHLLTERVGSDYHIINVAGDNVSSLDHVKTMIGFHPKTITVTCGRFNTGVTVPEWDMVLMLDDGKSAESYFQTIFRGQSPDQGRRKETCYVIDYNVQRLIEVVYEYAAIMAKKNETVESSLRNFLEFAPILEHSANGIVKADIDLALALMSHIGGIEAQFGSQSLFRWSQLQDVTDVLEDVSPDAKSKHQQVIANNDIERGKNYETKQVNGSSSKPDVVNDRELRQMAITMMKSLPAYLLTDKHPDCQSIITSGHRDKFQEFTQITVDQFAELLDRKFVIEDRVDRCIHALLATYGA